MLTAEMLYSDVELGLAEEDSQYQYTNWPDPCDWIEANFYLYDTQELVTLIPLQRQAIRLALSRHADGSFRFKTVLWSWPKKSAKSTTLAAIHYYLAWHLPNGWFSFVGNDLKQSYSRVGFYFRENIMIAKRKRPADLFLQGIKVPVLESGTILFPNRARVEMLPVDPSGEAGGNQDSIVCSELWAWKSRAHQRMWSELTPSPTKLGRNQRYIDTYAGFSGGESPVLEMLYNMGVKQGMPLDDTEIYVNEPASMLSVWVTRHLFPWQTEEYYAEQASTLLPNEYRRMHDNQWAESTDKFIQIEWWDACQAEVPPLERSEQIIIAMDAGVSNDCFAVVGVSRRGDGDAAKRYVRFTRVWRPTPGTKLDYIAIKGEVRELLEQFPVLMVYYDEYQLHLFAQELAREYNMPVKAFNQGSDRLVADSGLQKMIMGRQLTHDGSHHTLREHLNNALGQVDKHESKLRLVKMDESLKIDLAVALSMAVDRANYLNIG